MIDPYSAILAASEVRAILSLINRTQITGSEAMTVVKIQARLTEILSWHDANKQQVAFEQQQGFEMAREYTENQLKKSG